MFSKNKQENVNLQKKMDLLIEVIEKSNIKELVYILGSKKEIIIRNTLAGVFRGIGIGMRSDSNYSDNSLYA